MSAGAVIAGLIIGLVVFILIIVIIVVCVVVLATPHVLIEQYSAELRNDYGMGHVIVSQEVVVDNYRWWSESAYEGEVFSRIYEDDDIEEIICQRVGDSVNGHDNCYKLTGASVGYYSVPRAMDKEKSDVPCPAIHDPVLPGNKKRTLTTCDMYEYDYDGSDGTYYQANWVEHDTEYPVLTYALSHDEDGNLEYNLTVEYTAFNGDKPTNETGLKPPTGAIIWDFTDGTGASSISRMFHKAVDKVKSFFASPKDTLNPAAAATKRRLEREKLFRERAGIHAMPSFVGTVKSSPAAKNIRDDEIPESFDARDYWGYCKDVIGSISNQKSCGSCWAMSTAAVLSDRACIKNVTHMELSPQYMMSCYPHQLSCNGGYISTVWKDVEKYGSVSLECDPFVAKDTECPAKCKDGSQISNTTHVYNVGYNTPWAKDDDGRVKAIQKEIMTNGPVTVSMMVFSGLYKYKSGVYVRKSTEEYSGGHMVRMIGWGKEDGKDYWLVANSWDTDWGLNGLFKIRRGTNECNIENAVVGGVGIIAK